MALVEVQIPEKLTVSQKMHGAVNKAKAKLLPVTTQSMERLEICLGCEYYSENTINAERGRKICRICKCPVADKVLDPAHTCALPDPLKKW